MVRLLGIPIYDQPLSVALEKIVSTCLDAEAVRANRMVSATGAHGLVYARRNVEFAKTLESFEMNLPDGLPGVWIGRHIKGATRMERTRGADFFRKLMVRSAGTPIRHFLCGGKEGVAKRLSETCRDQFGNTNVVGVYSPPFTPLTDHDWSELAARIRASNADIVWIGLSTPKQEAFAAALAKHVSVHYIATIGAAFDFHIGLVREAPRFIQRSGLEWFYRMCMDPKRLVRRYAEVVPLFLYYNLRDAVRWR